MKRLFFALITLLSPLATGCQNPAFVNVGQTPNGTEAGIPEVSLKEFAKQQGISRREARQVLIKAKEEMELHGIEN
ncbi:MAG: hypothetical protein JXB62_15130 [Pirellulales bacterium]|nr:hypothetical protein [Pirellulales bacterium]